MDTVNKTKRQPTD
jgi:hypothetical protein